MGENGRRPGHVIAQYNLGIMHANGRGVSQSDVEAAKWYRLAAERGYVLAQSSLGLHYATEAAFQRRGWALMWLTLAAERGDSKAVIERDAVARAMSAADISRQKNLRRNGSPNDGRGRFNTPRSNLIYDRDRLR